MDGSTTTTSSLAVGATELPVVHKGVATNSLLNASVNQRQSIIMAPTSTVLGVASWLSKQAAHVGWRKRWYELSANKLSWYSTASKKKEIGNLPLFLFDSVEEGSKPLLFIIRTKDPETPQITLQAVTQASRDEWVKTIQLVIEQRKARAVEEQLRSTSSVPVPSSSSLSVAAAAAAPRTGVDNSNNPVADGGARSRAERIETEADRVAATETIGDVEVDDPANDGPSDSMSKEAQEKFVLTLRQLVLERDVAGVRAMLDPKPPRDALIWFSKEELGRTLLHLAVDSGDVKVTDLIGSLDTRLLELADQLGWLPLHLAAYTGSTEMGELLLKLGAKVDEKDNLGRSPFYIALAAGQCEFAKMLTRRAPDLWPGGHVAALGGVRAHLEAAADLMELHPTNKLNALHVAASSCVLGSADAVLFLLEKGFEVNAPDFLGKTALHFAAVAGALQSLRVLLAKGANVAAVDASKKTALHLAAGSGHAEVSEMLLADSKCPHSAEDEAGWSPLHLACFHGRLPVVRVLVAKGARVDARGPRALTPLMMCSSDEVAPIAAHLLQHGADPNTINREGRTALFDAVASRSMEVCKLLIKAEVNVNRLDEAQTLAVHLALDWPEGMKLLLENKADPSARLATGSTLVYEMSVRGQLEVLRLLKSRGVDTWAPTSSTLHLRRSGLHGAAANGHVEVVKYFLDPEQKEGARVEMRDKDGRTAVHLACEAGSVPVLQVLLDAGASSVELDDNGNTPMHVAAEKAQEGCIRLLKQHGGAESVDQRNMVGKTPLHLAAESKSYACVSLLLEGCPDKVPEMVDDSGRSALHYALRANDMDSAIDLIWAGASPSTPDKDGVRPFHLAARLGKKKVLVEMHECDPSWVDNAGRNPLHYAAAGGSADALEILIELVEPEKVEELVRARDGHGTTALHFASEFNHADCAKRLLDAKATVDHRNDVGLYPIHTASKKGKAALEVILNAGLETPGVDARDNDELTPLLIAILHGNVQGTHYLLEQGANVHAVDQEGMTALHAAMEPGDGSGARLLRLLLDRGAVPSALDANGCSPLHLAATSGRARCLEILLGCPGVDVNQQDGAGRSALILAASAGHVRCVEVLCRDSRVNVNAGNREGANALHVATMNGKFECARVLLSRDDMRVAATDGSSRTALHNSCLHDNVEFTNLFLHKYGIDANVTTNQDVTPLHEACVRGSLRCAKILLEAKANVNSCALQGLTPLHNAASFAQNEIIELLVQWKAEIDAVSDRKLTAMHCAAAMSHSRTLVLLVKLGAEVDPLDANLESPLHKAAQAGSVSCVTCLIERGAQVNLVNDAGERPIDKAKKRKHGRVMELLHENQ